MRVSGVLMSWLMPASISVRCCTNRSMRSRISMKAAAARRISCAPCGLNPVKVCPLPKRLRRLGKPLDRFHLVAQEQARNRDQHQDEPIIQRMKMSAFDAVTRSRGTSSRSTPSFN